MLAYNQGNDPWPMHVDPEAADKSPYVGVIASGGYTISIMYRLGHEIYNRADLQWAFLGGFDWHLKFVEPVRAGDSAARTDHNLGDAQIKQAGTWHRQVPDRAFERPRPRCAVDRQHSNDGDAPTSGRIAASAGRLPRR